VAIPRRLKKALVLALKIGIAAGLLLWLLSGSAALSVGDIQDWTRLCSKLAAEGAAEAPSAGRRIWELLPPEIRATIQDGGRGKPLERSHKAAIIDAFTEILKRRDFYSEDDFGALAIPSEARALLERDRDTMSERRIRRLNRLLLQASYPTEIASSRKLDPHQIAAAIRDQPLWLGLAFLIYNVCMLLTANRWRMLLVAQGLPARRIECIGMAYTGAFFSCFLPGATGGDVVKAYYVARDSDKKAEAVTTVFFDRFFGLYCMVGFACVATLVSAGRLWSYGGEAALFGLTQAQFLVVLVLSVFVAATVGLAVLLSPYWRRLTHLLLDRLRGFGLLLKRVYEAIYLYRGHKRVLVKFVAYSVISHALISLSMYCVGRAVGDPIACGGTRAFYYLLLIPLGLVINGLPITPAGLGAFEVACAWLFGVLLLKGEPNLGANVAALGHIVFLLTNQIGLVFYLKGKRRIAEAAHESTPEPLPNAAQ